MIDNLRHTDTLRHEKISENKVVSGFAVSGLAFSQECVCFERFEPYVTMSDRMPSV